MAAWPGELAHPKDRRTARSKYLRLQVARYGRDRALTLCASGLGGSWTTPSRAQASQRWVR